MLILTLLQNPAAALAFIAGLVLGITIHEFSHAYVAYRLGDPTAKLAGRLTLDPRSHLDPIGTLALLLVGFGWGKPTPFDPFNLRNIKRDSALISAAGAVSNLILAFVLSLPYIIAYVTGNPSLQIVEIYRVLSIIIWINVILAVFNLIPVAPLDGFKVLAGLLPRNWYDDFMQTERFGIFILLFLMITGAIGRIILPIVSALTGLLLPGLRLPI
ncbi:MAG: site-2 protease family protein [Candidatus Curtissbacteria bacterium]|nr:site-2 protease family protein [Candidatus Curtissbacteria bacterium]